MRVFLLHTLLSSAHLEEGDLAAEGAFPWIEAEPRVDTGLQESNPLDSTQPGSMAVRTLYLFLHCGRTPLRNCLRRGAAKLWDECELYVYAAGLSPDFWGLRFLGDQERQGLVRALDRGCPFEDDLYFDDVVAEVALAFAASRFGSEERVVPALHATAVEAALNAVYLDGEGLADLGYGRHRASGQSHVQGEDGFLLVRETVFDGGVGAVLHFVRLTPGGRCP